MRLIITVFFLALYFYGSSQFVTEDKMLTTPTGNLKGTLIYPTVAKKFKLVIIQAGSGPTDRNGNSGKAVTANSYRLLAEALSAKNIATLLVDKRGVAGSIGALKSELTLRFDDYADGLAAWVAFIKTDKRIQKVFIAGHSEGSLVGMLAAQKVKVSGYISIAGAGENIDKIITWQYGQQMPKVGLMVDSLFTRMKNKQPLDTVPPYLLSIFRPSVQPYILSWMLHNPCEEIKKLNVPVLIIQGTTDIQVTMKQALLLKECKPAATFTVIEGMNHILKQAPEDRIKNIATYTDEKLPLIPQFVSAIVTFISKN